MRPVQGGMRDNTLNYFEENDDSEFNQHYEYMNTILDSMQVSQGKEEFEKAITEFFKKNSSFYKDILGDYHKNTMNSIEYLQTEFGIKGSFFDSSE